MTVAQRGRAALVGGTLIALAAAVPAAASTTLPAAGARSSAHISVAHSCAQTVARGHYACFAERRTDLGFATRKQVAATPQATPAGYGPANLQSAYNVVATAAASGSGQRV